MVEVWEMRKETGFLSSDIPTLWRLAFAMEGMTLLERHE
jgi:hypothetical protein